MLVGPQKSGRLANATGTCGMVARWSRVAFDKGRASDAVRQHKGAPCLAPHSAYLWGPRCLRSPHQVHYVSVCWGPQLRNANERKQYDSRTDNTDRDAERTVAERRILLPDVQGETDRAAVPEQKRACEDRGRTGESRAVHREIPKKKADGCTAIKKASAIKT